MYEFKKWGNGSSCYEVLLLSDYNTITKTYRYTSLGLVKKEGSKWVAVGKEKIVGKSRNEVADMLAEKL
jgi:hypothetical protein